MARPARIRRDLPRLGEAFPIFSCRLEGGDRLQRPSPPSSNLGLSFLTDAKAEDGRAWVEIVPGCQGPWFSLQVDKSWAPWAFSKSSPSKVIAALELLIAVKLWVPDSEDRQSSRVALRGFTDNQSSEALVKKAMTTKYPSSLIRLELAEELAAKRCDLNLTWIRRDLNQLADDLTNEKFDSFDPNFRVSLKRGDMRWRVLDRLLGCADSFYSELRKRKATLSGSVGKAGKIRKLKPW